MHRLSILALILAVVLTFLVHTRAYCKVYSGSITGLATDPTGALVPAATVTLTDENKGFTFSGASGSDGRYVLRNLPPGNYKLSASAPGMQTYTQAGIILTVGQNAEADVHFVLQSTTQTVEVMAAVSLVQTQDASTGQLVNQNYLSTICRLSGARCSIWRSSRRDRSLAPRAASRALLGPGNERANNRYL